jgi:hypothetical protein
MAIFALTQPGLYFHTHAAPRSVRIRLSRRTIVHNARGAAPRSLQCTLVLTAVNLTTTILVYVASCEHGYRPPLAQHALPRPVKLCSTRLAYHVQGCESVLSASPCMQVESS